MYRYCRSIISRNATHHKNCDGNLRPNMASDGESCSITGCASPANWKSIAPGKLPVIGDDSIMDQKEHGTSRTPVQQDLRYKVDVQNADKICNYNRHYAERSGYFKTTDWEKSVPHEGTPTIYYDSNTGKPLFRAPVGRTWDEFLKESERHGWPSFRDEEVNWDNVRVLRNGETVSVDGTHLGHNIPSGGRNRYCINLICVAGNPAVSE
eukprot:TRINITY_DN497_c0_g1_i1.p1 TRINITY_DN497_c0_g1~~TRINITY_DN497_c0_g1_i1.p1  ORF type:complete len:209 (-),score=34.69 TRINITY_DN497_c0_g1_i1:113-739(-)